MGIDAGGVLSVGNAGAKKPQLLQQQTDVVAGAVHHGMQGISVQRVMLDGSTGASVCR